MPRASVSPMWWRLANRSRSRRLLQRLSIPSTPTSSRYQARMRTPRRMRVSGIARRKLIRSRSAAEETVSGSGRRRFRRPHAMLAVPTRAAGPHFEPALRGQVTLLRDHDGPSHLRVCLSAQRRSEFRSFPRQNTTASLREGFALADALRARSLSRQAAGGQAPPRCDGIADESLLQAEVDGLLLLLRRERTAGRGGVGQRWTVWWSWCDPYRLVLEAGKTPCWPGIWTVQLAHLPAGVLFQHTLRISRGPIPHQTLNQPCNCQGKGGSLRN